MWLERISVFNFCNVATFWKCEKISDGQVIDNELNELKVVADIKFADYFSVISKAHVFETSDSYTGAITVDISTWAYHAFVSNVCEKTMLTKVRK